ncbi:ABC transporter permease [Schaalia sp. 19OD2882]|uniref:ABC transporter permease n=1 Tax=Schaalia sp. 19OD2882 TaxID=2794089 RepID=UPI001C1EE16E|nr:ABC transporter permease [Schaalia sp. 19OD2882]QWW19053.1 ABC transporter permease [Schaalia sp. 19OD2882]
MSASDLVRSSLRGTAVSLRRMPGSVAASLVLVLLLIVLSGISPFLEPVALTKDLALGVTPAGTAGHPLGTDTLGRDVLLMSMAGTASAIVGPVAVALGSTLLGIVFGITAAWRGGLWDAVVSRACEILLALPVTLLAIVVAGILGGGYWVTVAVLVLLFAPSDVRMVRAATLQQLPRPYVESALALGMPTGRILTFHLLPNVAPIIWANLFVNVAFALVSLAGLSFLGFGVSAQAADWGRQLADGRAFIFQNPAASVVPGVLVIVAAAAINVAGDWASSRSERRAAR